MLIRDTQGGNDWIGHLHATSSVEQIHASILVIKTEPVIDPAERPVQWFTGWIVGLLID